MPAPPPPPSLGTIGRYALRSVLGEGGMGRVYRAELRGPAGFRKEVALKVVRVDGPAGDLAHEARLGGLLRHPNLVDVYELGEQGGRLFIAMELVEGPTVSALLRKGPIPPRAALEIAIQVCAGLSSAHALPGGLVHRDIKPANLLIDRSGLVKIADFGVARSLAQAAAPGVILGTPSWMSPEQILGHPLDGRSDLFSLSAVLYSTVTGRRLFSGADRDARLRATLDVERRLASPEWAALDGFVPGLAETLKRGLRRQPSRRWPDCGAFADALRGLLARPELKGPGLAEVLQIATPAATPAELLRPGPQAAPPDESTWLLDPAASLETLDLAPPTNLGDELDRFFGREPEQAALAALYDDGARLVTLKGAGGLGKTRLSQRFGRSALGGRAGAEGGFPGGVWFCDLSEVEIAQGLLFTVASALDVPLERAEVAEVQRQLGYAIGDLGRALLILDNCEQIIDAASAAAKRWLQGAPEICLLATSRAPLGVPGERLLELEPLGVETGEQLFLERASARGLSAETARAEAPAIRALVERLEGLPLAIELAASRAGAIPPRALLERLGDRPHLLGGRRGAARQATLRGAIGWSWDLLTPWEQGALAQISVFRGGFELEAAEAVLDLSPWSGRSGGPAPWAVDVVGALWESSLLRSATEGDQPRFGPFESVRSFAAERLSPQERAKAERRHAAHFAGFGEHRALDALRGPEARPRWRALRRELENLMAATRAPEARPADAAACCRAATVALWDQGPLGLAAELMDDCLARADLKRADRADLLVRCGLTASLLGDRTRGLLDIRRAVDLAGACGAKRIEVRALAALGWALLRQQEKEEALETLTWALELAIAHGARRAECEIRGSLAYLFNSVNELERAREELEGAVALAESLGDARGQAKHLSALGRVLSFQGQLERALELNRRALQALEGVDSRQAKAPALQVTGQLLYQLGRGDEARRLFQEATSIYRALGRRDAEARAALLLGIQESNRGNSDIAERRLRAAQEILGSMGARQLEVKAFLALAILYSRLGRVDEAQVALEDAALRRLPGDPNIENRLVMYRGQLLWDRGDLEAARAIFERVAASFAAQGRRYEEAIVQERLGTIALERGDLAVARHWLERATSVHGPHLMLVFAAMAELYARLGDAARGRVVLAKAEAMLGPYEADLLRARVLSFRARVRLLEGEVERAVADARAVAALIERIGVGSPSVLARDLADLRARLAAAGRAL